MTVTELRLHDFMQTVSARDLHAFLGLARDFNQWMREQIERVRLAEGRDFQSYEDVGLAPHVAFMLHGAAGSEVKTAEICESGRNTMRQADQLPMIGLDHLTL
jgi:hypothetical protein